MISRKNPEDQSHDVPFQIPGFEDKPEVTRCDVSRIAFLIGEAAKGRIIDEKPISPSVGDLGWKRSGDLLANPPPPSWALRSSEEALTADEERANNVNEINSKNGVYEVLKDGRGGFSDEYRNALEAYRNGRLF